MLSANHGTNGSYVSEMSPVLGRSHAGNMGIKSPEHRWDVPSYPISFIPHRQILVESTIT